VLRSQKEFHGWAMRVPALSLRWSVLALCLLSTLPPEAFAQPRAAVGPGKCIDCHQHRDAKLWAEKQDGDGKGKRHINAINQLEDSRAAGWGRRIGVNDVYDVKGACVQCHATVVGGSPDFGVSCESCHGPGRDYLKPHQDKGAYQTAVSLGMRDIIRKPDPWVRQCVGCHVLSGNPSFAALLDAGHPSGGNFDVAAKFGTIALHFTSKYPPGQIADMAARVRGSQTGAARPPAPPAVVPPAPSVAPPAAATPAAAPMATPKAATPGAAPPAPRTTTSAAPIPPVPIPPPSTPAGRPAAQPPPELQPRGVPAQAPTAAPAPADATPEALPEQRQEPTTPAEVASAAQGRVVDALSTLLRQGVRSQSRLQMSPAPAYRGADSALLKLQQEIIALGLEALTLEPSRHSGGRQ
jgi:hypothetical protein